MAPRLLVPLEQAGPPPARACPTSIRPLVAWPLPPAAWPLFRISFFPCLLAHIQHGFIQHGFSAQLALVSLLPPACALLVYSPIRSIAIRSITSFPPPRKLHSLAQLQPPTTARQSFCLPSPRHVSASRPSTFHGPHRTLPATAALLSFSRRRGGAAEGRGLQRPAPSPSASRRRSAPVDPVAEHVPRPSHHPTPPRLTLALLSASTASQHAQHCVCSSID